MASGSKKEMGKETDEEFPAQWAIDIMRGKTLFKPTYATNHRIEWVLTLTGASAPAWQSFINNQPFTRSLHRYVLSALVGYIIGHIAQEAWTYRANKRDAITVDYIKRYPELFPKPPNRKIAEIFEPWYPAR